MCGHLLRIKQLKNGRYGSEHAGWLQGTSSPPKGQPRAQILEKPETSSSRSPQPRPPRLRP